MIARINFKNIPENKREQLFFFPFYNSMIKPKNNIGVVMREMAIAFEFTFGEQFSGSLVLRDLNEEVNKDFENKLTPLNDQLLKIKEREKVLKWELCKSEKNLTQLESGNSSSMF